MFGCFSIESKESIIYIFRNTWNPTIKSYPFR
nr:MAG TPA: hypothetical protein [Bacteriophage sp.]